MKRMPKEIFEWNDDLPHEHFQEIHPAKTRYVRGDIHDEAVRQRDALLAGAKAVAGGLREGQAGWVLFLSLIAECEGGEG